VVSHAGSRLLADVADRTTLTAQLGEELAGLRKPRARHDPGRVLVDMAVAVADGATTISDVAVLADQGALFGAVASDSTCWRLLAHLDTVQLGAIARARAAAREVVWAQRAELSGAVPAGTSSRPGTARAGDRPGCLDRGLPQREGAGGSDVLLLTELPRSSLVSLDVERVVESYLPRP
jgi:Transposase DDE domain group 1